MISGLLQFDHEAGPARLALEAQLAIIASYDEAGHIKAEAPADGGRLKRLKQILGVPYAWAGILKSYQDLLLPSGNADDQRPHRLLLNSAVTVLGQIQKNL